MLPLSKQTLDGNVETIILAELMAKPNYGYALVQEIQERHAGALKLGEGTIYPVLYRMEEKGLLRSETRRAENGRERKYYAVAAKGKRAFEENMQQWKLLKEVMNKIQGAANATALPAAKSA